MCDWCATEATKAFCPDCGTWVCKDAEPGNEWPAALLVTSYGDAYCWNCGLREQGELARLEEEEAEEWGWMEHDPYDDTDRFDLTE